MTVLHIFFLALPRPGRTVEEPTQRFRVRGMAPITQWRIYFPGPDANGYFVDMRTDALSAVAYKYGTYIHNADNTQGKATTVGDLNVDSKYDASLGALSFSNTKIGNPQASGRLSRNVRAFPSYRHRTRQR